MARWRRVWIGLGDGVDGHGGAQEGIDVESPSGAVGGGVEWRRVAARVD